MRTNRVKEKLQHGEPVFGTWLSMGDLYAARVLARIGFDWLTLDMEHSPIDWSTAASLFGAIADAGSVPLVRVPEGNHHYIKRALDAGAWGIIVPMVDTVEQARSAIAAAKYPPEGNRSAGGGMHALNFAASAGEYYARANDEILIVLQTESPRGVSNAREIYSLPGCDAIFIGPNDLRFQMRSPEGIFPTDESHAAMIAEVVRVGREVGTPTGIHAMSAEEASRRVEQGMQFIAIGSDIMLMGQAAGAVVRQVMPERSADDVVRY